jgi:hypothetical protein
MDEEAVLWSATRYQDDSGMVHGCTTEHGTRQLPRPSQAITQQIQGNNLLDTSQKTLALNHHERILHAAHC